MSDVDYIEKTSVVVSLLGPGLDPAEITRQLGLKPVLVLPGTWSFETNPRKLKDLVVHPACDSPDVNQHLRTVLSLFKPLMDRIRAFSPPPSLTVQIKWESNASHEEGPEIAPDCLSGLAEIGAKLSFAQIQIPSRPKTYRQ